ncbi:hypothetical protein JZ751_013243 [Albula glossodonta]|uniref:Uncharacterized protein n=1 Tax=Albula glossodonta TaxID=121402 RepID=A0A8T2NUG8_9TELE|nr:hypothetical protein JZ751_013243 [Albula glossodonta]
MQTPRNSIPNPPSLFEGLRPHPPPGATPVTGSRALVFPFPLKVMDRWQPIREEPLCSSGCHARAWRLARRLLARVRGDSSSKVKQIEKEYSQKLARSSQTIAELQASVCVTQEENRLQKQEAERHLQEASARWEEERRRITRDADRTGQALQERVESLQKQLHSAEKRLRCQELETQEQLCYRRTLMCTATGGNRRKRIPSPLLYQGMKEQLHPRQT